jgi:hypothetical protein
MRQKVPGAFFQLVESVEADIYLFCDQDDIWQPGKIDVTVAALNPYERSCALCFSDARVFSNENPDHYRSCFEMVGVNPSLYLSESRVFMNNLCLGNTAGFTRPLRDLFMSHKDIARTYAVMHDWWMYVIATASGKAWMLRDAPTTLYRVHQTNTVGLSRPLAGWRSIAHWYLKLQQQTPYRRQVSRHAQGFCLASTTLPRGQKLERLLPIAKLVANLDQRQSVGSICRLALGNAMPPGMNAAWLSAACLCTPARDL